MTAFILLVLILAAPAMAATPAACTAAVPTTPTIRAEGKTELAGDVVLTCTGGTPTAAANPVPQVNVTIFLNALVTSRPADVLLLIDEPGSKGNPNQLLCASTVGCGLTGAGSGVKYDGFAGRPNIYQGSIGGGSVTFFGVPLDAPAANGSRTLRVVNLRMDATGGAKQITANVSISNVSVNNQSVVVAQVAQGLTFSVDPTDFAIPSGTVGKNNRAVTLRFAPA